MVNVGVGNSGTGDPRFLATTCTYPHGGFVTIFTAASLRRREGLVATLTKYLENKVECHYLHSRFQRQLVYQTSRRRHCTKLHGGNPRAKADGACGCPQGHGGRSLNLAPTVHRTGRHQYDVKERVMPLPNLRRHL